MLTGKTRLSKLKIIYRYSDVEDIETNTAHNEHLINFYKLVENDPTVDLCYLLSVEEVRLTSILIEFNVRKQVDMMEKDLLRCGFDLDFVEIKKVTGRTKQMKMNYLIVAMEQGSLPYVHHRHGSDTYLTLLNALQ